MYVCCLLKNFIKYVECWMLRKKWKLNYDKPKIIHKNHKQFDIICDYINNGEEKIMLKIYEFILVVIDLYNVTSIIYVNLFILEYEDYMNIYFIYIIKLGFCNSLFF